jgi:hypothetical protein
MRKTSLTKELVDVVKRLQFGFNHNRCPLCAGWNVGPNGETNYVHTETCIVKRVLDKVERTGQ